MRSWWVLVALLVGLSTPAEAKRAACIPPVDAPSFVPSTDRDAPTRPNLQRAVMYPDGDPVVRRRRPHPLDRRRLLLGLLTHGCTVVSAGAESRFADSGRQRPLRLLHGG